MTNIKNVIEWSEKSPSRARNLVLFSTIILYFIVTIFLITVSFITTVPVIVVNIYYSLSAIFVSTIGFFTTTHPKTAETLSQENQIKNNETQLNYFKEIFDKVLSNAK